MTISAAQQIVGTIIDNPDLREALKLAFAELSARTIQPLRQQVKSGNSVQAAWYEGKASAFEEALTHLAAFGSNYKVAR